MIKDGPDVYPNSCVAWVKFKTFEMRELFARHREREWILQRDLEHAIVANDRLLMVQLKAALEEVQRAIVFMACNCTGSRREVEERRRGAFAGEKFRAEEEREDVFPTVRIANALRRLRELNKNFEKE